MDWEKPKVVEFTRRYDNEGSGLCEAGSGDTGDCVTGTNPGGTCTSGIAEEMVPTPTPTATPPD